jgi:hypothetical protein
MFAYDLGFGIDLDQAERELSGEGPSRAELKHGRRAPRYVQYEPPPLRVTRAVSPRTIAGFTATGEVDAVFYDFGVVCLTWRIPIAGSFEDLLSLALALYENEGMLAESRTLAGELLDRIRHAVDRPNLAALVEDYVVFHAEAWEGGGSPHDFLDANARAIARLLRAEEADLSPEEVHESLGVRASYSTADAAVIDWNAALLLGPDQSDALAILEFANVELLEMRFLDAQLDRALTRAYEAVQRGGGPFPRGISGELQRIARLQVDSALLFEGVNNALKLVGDQYLARLYRLAGQRLHLPEWDTSILRKLDTLETIYDKVHDRQSTRRLEILEWIIILLIALSVAMSFMG